jgi:predicted Zn-dependent protease
VLSDFQRYQGASGGDTPVEKFEFALLLAANDRYDQAESVMQKLQQSDPDRITYRLALAEIQRGARQTDEALAVYRDTLDLYPDDMAVVLPYATTLMDSGREEDAYQVLSDTTANHQENARAFKLLAQAAGATGHTVQTHTAMSQYYFLNGFTNQAIEQLKLAEKQPGLNNYLTARIQARITQLETLLEAEKLE